MARPGAPDSPAAPVLALSALLSRVLVALTIQMDITYETRAPHRTTALGGTGPWLISYAMWANFLRLLPEEGLAAGDLSERSGQGRRPLSPKAGMVRWGYVSLEPPPAATVTRGPSDLIVRPRKAARLADALWEEVLGEVESRWRDRFGAALVDLLRADGEWAAGLAGRTLPGYLPVLGPRLLSGPPTSEPVAGPPSLVTALANALHAFAIEAESGWPVGLAALSNPLRVLGDGPVRLADIPRRTGVGKEATAFASGVLARLGALDIGSDPAVGRGRIVRRTARGGVLQARSDLEHVADGLGHG